MLIRFGLRNFTQGWCFKLADRAGVALAVIRKIEQGKDNLSLTKVNQVLLMFGSKLIPMNSKEVEEGDREKFFTVIFLQESLLKLMMANIHSLINPLTLMISKAVPYVFYACYGQWV